MRKLIILVGYLDKIEKALFAWDNNTKVHVCLSTALRAAGYDLLMCSSGEDEAGCMRVSDG